MSKICFQKTNRSWYIVYISNSLSITLLLPWIWRVYVIVYPYAQNIWWHMHGIYANHNLHVSMIQVISKYNLSEPKFWPLDPIYLAIPLLERNNYFACKLNMDTVILSYTTYNHVWLDIYKTETYNCSFYRAEHILQNAK